MNAIGITFTSRSRALFSLFALGGHVPMGSLLSAELLLGLINRSTNFALFYFYIAVYTHYSPHIYDNVEKFVEVFLRPD
jgi:hypothetical protein